MAGKAFGQKRTMNDRQRSELFVSRRNRQQLLQFTEIEPALLYAALQEGMRAGATISFAPAQGGIGITLRVYRGDYADVEFAGSGQELSELLALLVEGFASGSEDAVEIARAMLQKWMGTD